MNKQINPNLDQNLKELNELSFEILDIQNIFDEIEELY